MRAKQQVREEKEKSLLLGLIDLYILTGNPVSSNTLKDHGFQDISSATIRNYFVKLEQQGLLKQQHASGGRIPTASAYKIYASHYLKQPKIEIKEEKKFKKFFHKDIKEIAYFLQHAAEELSEITKSAVFLSFPRFDQDLIINLKLVGIDTQRYLCILITDFGLIHTEVFHSQKKLSNFSLKRIESYFHFRLTGLDKPKLSSEEEKIAIRFYNEILLRHIVNYANFSKEDIYKTGFSKLLHYPEFRDATILATSLSTFENTSHMRKLLSTCCQNGELTFWIGEEETSSSHSTILAIPYFINGKAVGALALLGPIRMPYQKLFGTLKTFSSLLSENLKRSLYKYKITFREPKTQEIANQPSVTTFDQTHYLQLEDKS